MKHTVFFIRSRSVLVLYNLCLGLTTPQLYTCLWTTVHSKVWRVGKPACIRYLIISTKQELLYQLIKKWLLTFLFVGRLSRDADVFVQMFLEANRAHLRGEVDLLFLGSILGWNLTLWLHLWSNHLQSHSPRSPRRFSGDRYLGVVTELINPATA